MDERCRNCKWWKAPNWQTTDEGDDDVWKNCVLTESDGNSPKNRADTLAYGTDGESYYAILRTHRDFGCVQWEPK